MQQFTAQQRAAWHVTIDRLLGDTSRTTAHYLKIDRLSENGREQWARRSSSSDYLLHQNPESD